MGRLAVGRQVMYRRTLHLYRCENLFSILNEYGVTGTSVPVNLENKPVAKLEGSQVDLRSFQ